MKPNHRTDHVARRQTGRPPRPRGSCCIRAAGIVALAIGSAGADPDPPRDAPPTHADAQAPDVDPLAGELASDELLLFADIQSVVSATRRSIPITTSPVPISVVDSDAIASSGLTRVEDLLLYVPGIDVLDTDRNRSAVGVRGLHDPTADRTLVLIDGRNASSPLFGGAELFRHPLFIHDIDRIEVVRGPGGAAWGANAFNGVVNIIKKRPEDTRGLMLSTTVTHFGDTYSQMRYGAGDDDTSWRISTGFRNHRSSASALNANFDSRDFEQSPAVDGEITHRLSPDASLSAGVGYRFVQRGDHEFIDFFPQENESHHTLRAFARLDLDLDNDASAYLQWFTNYLSSSEPSVADTSAFETDLEAQINFAPGPSHETFVGGNVRWSHLRSSPGDPLQIQFQDFPVNEVWAGAFVGNRWRVTERLTLDTQLRADHYSETGFDWSGRAAAMLAIDERHRHVARVAVARSFRAPLVGFRRSAIRRAEIAPGLFGLVVDPNDDLRNESIVSFEAGYSGQLTDEVTLRADAYIQRYRRLIGVRENPDPLGLGRQLFQFDNLGGADAHGAEVELAYTHESFTASAWYAWNHFRADNSDQDVRAFRPAHHKVGASLGVRLPADWSVNARYRYTDNTPGSPGSGTGARAFHRLDLNLARRLGEHGELMLGVLDVLDDTTDPVFGIGQFTAHERPGRTAFVRLSLVF